MSFFCISCQFTRGLFRRNHCTDQLYQKIKLSSPFTSLTNVRHSRGLANNSMKLCGRVTESREERPSVILSSNFFMTRQTFCTRTKHDENNEEDNVKRETTEKDGEERMVGELENLEKSLTEEERQILRELEEEERRYRENAEEDYSVWDGSFDVTDNKRLSESVSEGHVRFENRQRVIQDVIEEMWDPLSPSVEEKDEPQYYPRGKTGVFDLGELVHLLREENANEVVAISIPKEFDYADHMVIVTVSNNKHLLALATFIRKRCKQKDLKPTDNLPALDNSVNHHGWIALDLGNIILQIFLQDVRDYYDLETLWTVGPLFDDLTNAQDPEIVQLLNSIK